ncbi:MAG: DUF2029 domain-containing protein [Saprospiraceae bacterium]|nr:DUF2029 domain-containing protein [Saprospiraceae bacterium]
MNNKQALISRVLLLLIGFVLLIELIRDAGKSGDFIGYVQAGQLVLSKEDIYSDYLNTWPPLFSVFSVLLTWGDQLNSYFLRFFWLLGSIVSMFFIIRESLKMTIGRSPEFIGQKQLELLQSPIVLVPILIMLRYIMDNLANVQINIYLLLCAVFAVSFFIQRKYIWVGVLLGLSISLKVITIFFLLYFLYKRAFKPVFWTLFFALLFNAVSVLVFGFDQALTYYQQWATEIAPRSLSAIHKNQSVFGFFLRMFSAEHTGMDLQINVLDLSKESAKNLGYLIVLLFSLFPAFWFRKKLNKPGSLASMLEYAVVFTVVPLLSPLAWKSYFIFLWFPYFISYLLLFQTEHSWSLKTILRLKYLFGLSVVLTVFSSELFVGAYFSDVLEVYSVITIGTILLLLLQLVLVRNLHKFKRDT